MVFSPTHRRRGSGPGRFFHGIGGCRCGGPALCLAGGGYSELHFGSVTSERFITLLGDAELDEGNIWEAVIDDTLTRLGNVIWIVDLNRQSLDRVIPGIKALKLKRLFASAGWDVLEAKYGTSLEAVMNAPGGDAVRQRIDTMPNEEYQALIPDLRWGRGAATHGRCSRSPAS